MTSDKPAIVAPVAWQSFGKWCLTGQHGMRPIYLSVSPKGILMDRDPVGDRLIPLTDETPVARQLVAIINSHADLLAENARLRASLEKADATLLRSMQEHGCDPCHITEVREEISAALSRAQGGAK